MVTGASEKEVEFMKKLGDKLGYIRVNSNYTQAEIAKRSECSRNHISMVEQGKERLTVYQMEVYCRATHTSPNEILGYEEINISPLELQLLYKFKRLDEDKQRVILDMIK